MRKLEAAAPEVRVRLSEPVDYEAFATGLRDTKLFISPFGCGTLCNASPLVISFLPRAPMWLCMGSSAVAIKPLDKRQVTPLPHCCRHL